MSDKRKLQEQHEKILTDLIQSSTPNKYCADCGAKGPRWASHSLGIFLCIGCAGIHRKLGTHLSKVKSVNLDSWTPEQIENMKAWGNEKANALYNPNNVQPPSGDSAMEQFIRDKYERKKLSNAQRPQPRYSMSESSKPVLSVGYSASLQRMKEMGFRDEEKNLNALYQTKGKVEEAIEIVARNASGMESENYYFDSIAKLKAMGFTDEKLSLEVLAKVDGNVERAIEYLVDRRQIGSQKPAQQLQQQQQNIKPKEEKKKTAMDDLLGDFGGDLFATPAVQSTQQVQQPNSNKNAIMSLFGQNQQQSNFAPQMPAGQQNNFGNAGFNGFQNAGAGNGFSQQPNPNTNSFNAFQTSPQQNGFANVNAQNNGNGFSQQPNPNTISFNAFQTSPQQNGNGNGFSQQNTNSFQAFNNVFPQSQQNPATNQPNFSQSQPQPNNSALQPSNPFASQSNSNPFGAQAPTKAPDTLFGEFSSFNKPQQPFQSQLQSQPEQFQKPVTTFQDFGAFSSATNYLAQPGNAMNLGNLAPKGNAAQPQVMNVNVNMQQQQKTSATNNPFSF